MPTSFETLPIHPNDHADQLAQAVEGFVGQYELTGDIPEFDRLDAYTPEFEGQQLYHRSNAVFHPGDIIVPSNQISADMHHELNGRRGFVSTSSPHGSVTYDKQLAHAGTRDVGESYGSFLYVVAPLEGDTVRYGENFGAHIDRLKKVQSPALEGGRLATTTSHSGKYSNEVVSTRGFRVVGRIAHEPEYREALLPWPVSSEAVSVHRERRSRHGSVVATYEGELIRVPVTTVSRQRPGKIGPVDKPGAYRADANKLTVADIQTKFEARRRREHHLGQAALPGMLSARPYRTQLELIDLVPDTVMTRVGEGDVMLPGMDDLGKKLPPQV